MKFVILVILMFSSFSVFASEPNELASAAEIKFLCTAVNDQFVEWNTGVALNADQCSSVSATVVEYSKGLKIVSGVLNFKSSSTVFELNCQAAYVGDITSGISFGILCK